MTTTLVKLGPKDHGRLVTEEEYQKAQCKEGFRYEIINGRLYVSPVPNLPEMRLESWMFQTLLAYSAVRPDVINFVLSKSRVFVPGASSVTVPEPDVAAYRDFPVDSDIEDVVWQDVSPILVVEVLTSDAE